jgi:predicted transcriptional regulator of viral defense system
MDQLQDALFAVADRQQGYFTSQQAQECGFARSNFHYRLRSGEWEKAQRGIYRLARYPVTERGELVLWMLWSRDKGGNSQGVWSHETALDIHELSDVMPSKMHMTVPLRFRKRIEIPKILKLHFEDLFKEDVEIRQGYRVTTPLRTLLDIIKAESVSQDHIIQAIKEGIQRGILILQDMAKHPEFEKYTHGYKI